jgi:hypothetical protein
MNDYLIMESDEQVAPVQQQRIPDKEGGDFQVIIPG